MVVAIIRMASNLERIGDGAAKVGCMAAKLQTTGEKKSFYGEPVHLGEGVSAMLRGALDSSPARCGRRYRGYRSDHEIDREFKTLTRLLMTHMMEQPQRVKNMLREQLRPRLERIGDHAVNLWRRDLPVEGMMSGT